MQVEILTMPEARHELFHLLVARTPATRSDDAARLADVYLADIESILERHKGRPPDAWYVRDSAGNEFWWQYCNGVWVQYAIQDRKSGLFRLVRTVRITAFGAKSPFQ